MPVEYGSLPFDQAIEFFRQKINLPTERWTDLWQGMHARAFVVAGAMQDGLLSDLRTAVDRAIAEGTTLRDFRRDFDAIVQRTGWAYKGERGWRTRVIYETNLRTAYAAGRFQQQSDPKVLRSRPYWEYRHGDSRNPRPLHQSWDGIVLPTDDPWWQTHYPPNGWGCKCSVFALSDRDLSRSGRSGPDTAPDDGTYTWKNPQTGEAHEIPRGIDPGWAYNVGEAAWGRRLSEESMDQWRATRAAAWERLTPGDWTSAGRPERLPLDTPRAAVGPRLSSAAEVEAGLRRLLGGEERSFSYRAGNFTHAVVVNAVALARHVDLRRSEYLPFIEETLTDPFEVWLSFQRHRGTGLVVLRHRLVKAFRVGSKQALLVVAQAKRGFMEAYTFVPVDQLGYLQKQRVGRLLWSR